MTAAQIATSVSEWLYASGYRFLLPYLALYLIAWGAESSVETLTRAFVALHALNLPLLAVFVAARRRSLRLADLLFWTALLLLLLLPGAYLEYPTDPWEHLRRIALWQHVATVGEHDTAAFKFAYFWGYSLLFWVGPLERRLALDLYGAFWQILVACQVYALARRLGDDDTWSKLQVVAFLMLFGEGCWGLRFLALSSMPLAYLAFLRTLICWIDFLDGRDRRAWRQIPALCLLALANHRQEVIFIGIGSGALWLDAWLRSMAPAARARCVRVALGLALVAVAGQAVAWAVVPEIHPAVFHGMISRLGSFRIWQRWYFVDTYGLHGVLALGFAIALWRPRPRLTLLTWMPSLALLLPSAVVVAWVLAENGNTGVVHRILLGFPTSFALVAGLRSLFGGTLLDPGRREARVRALACTGLALLALGAPASYPWRGRLFFQLHRPHPDLELRFLDETAAWFLANRTLPTDCRILSDPATQYGVLAELGWPLSRIGINRLAVPREGVQIRSLPALLARIERDSICGVLVANRDEAPPPRRSALPRHFPAWHPRFASPAWLTHDDFRAAAEGLLERGWCKTRVPPWYDLYEPEAASGSDPDRCARR